MPRAFVVLTSLSLAAIAFGAFAHGDAVPESTARMREDLKFLASDELEGRGPGTKGIDTAAAFIKAEFGKAGLATNRVDGDAYQKFDLTVRTKLVEPYSLQLAGPDGTIDLKIGTDAEGCSFAGSGSFDGEIVFCGYAISTTDDAHGSPHGDTAHSKDANPHSTFEYNDFEGINLEGKIAIVMRRTPRQGDPKNPFQSEHGASQHETLRTKMLQLAAHKAAGVLFVNDPYSGKRAAEERNSVLAKENEKVELLAEEFLAIDSGDTEKAAAARGKLAEAVNQAKSVRAANQTADDDKLMKFGYAGNGDAKLPPAFHISIKTCNDILAGAKTNLAKLEAEIDSDLKPRSMVIPGWKAKGIETIEKERTSVANVIGVLDGEGPLADETVIIGAHYDHVGRGGPNSLAPGSTEIHNGADDNASGTSSLIELARRFGERAQKSKFPRRLVFIAFTGEEMGLLGSERYCKSPLYPLDKTVAMLNMDMVGRLKEDKLIVYGTGTSSRWEPELKKANEEIDLKLIFKPEGFGPSDHSSFYAKKIPVLHFFTGEHSDYHRPSDDWEKINYEGMARVTSLIEKIALNAVTEQEKPDYLEVKGTGGPIRSGNRPYVGTIPEFGNEEPGYSISGVSPGSPGDKGGLKGGDRIVKMGGHKITNLDDYDAALRRFAPGTEVDFVVVRGKEEVTVKVTLAPPK